MRSQYPFPHFSRLLLAAFFTSTVSFAAAPPDTSSLPTLQNRLHISAASAAQAATALAQMGPAAQPALGDLADALRFDEDIVTKPVGDAMLAIGPPSIQTLMLCLKDSNLFVRQRAAIILGRFGSKAKAASGSLASLVLDSSNQVTVAASQALLKIGPDALPALVSVFNQQDENSQLPLLDVIGGLGSPTIPFLLHTLAKNEGIFVRVKASEWLGSIRPSSPDVVNGLVDTLNNLDERVRLAAVNGLEALGTQANSAIGPLIVTSQTDSDPLVRQKALEALSAIGPATSASLPGLARALHSPEVEVRSAVVASLATCKDDPTHTLSILQAASRDSDSSVQNAAQSAITRLAPNTPPAPH